jgi:hypothetical protein
MCLHAAAAAVSPELAVVVISSTVNIQALLMFCFCTLLYACDHRYMPWLSSLRLCIVHMVIVVYICASWSMRACTAVKGQCLIILNVLRQSYCSEVTVMDVSASLLHQQVCVLQSVLVAFVC